MKHLNIRDKMIQDIGNLQKTRKVIIFINANEHFYSIQSRIVILTAFNKLMDLVITTHGADKESNTYKRRSKSIDFVLCTKTISKYIKRSGIIPFDVYG